MIKNSQKSRGFTLIEVIIYLALFSIIIGGGMVATYHILQSTDAGTNHVILEEEANFLLRKIDWALTGSTLVAVPTSSTLQSTKNIDGVSTLLTFNFSSPNLTLKRASGSANTLNSSSISVSALTFQKTVIGNGVKTSFTLTTVQNGRNVTDNFSTTKYLRQ